MTVILTNSESDLGDTRGQRLMREGRRGRGTETTTPLLPKRSPSTSKSFNHGNETKPYRAVGQEREVPGSEGGGSDWVSHNEQGPKYHAAGVSPRARDSPPVNTLDFM